MTKGLTMQTYPTRLLKRSDLLIQFVRNLICLIEISSGFPDDEQNFFTVMLISVPFLVVTFLIYGFIRELRNLHGKCLMCCIFGLTIFYFSMALNNLFQVELLEINWLCQTTGYIGYISILIAFFWLNVISYDIWSTFR